MYFGNTLHGQVMVIDGTNCTLSCNCNSRPFATFSWTYPGGQTDGNLLQLVVKRGNEGTLVCEAENAMQVDRAVVRGYNFTSVRLSVLCKYFYPLIVFYFCT